MTCIGPDRAEVHWHRREAGIGQGQRLALRLGQLRSELTNLNFAGSRGAVVTHEQLRSEFTTKASRETSPAQTRVRIDRVGNSHGARACVPPEREEVPMPVVGGLDIQGSG